MSTRLTPAQDLHSSSYQGTRFNALRHGVLSRYTVLPWEDEADYRALLEALLAEYAPDGPTEEHLVEELAGIIWRKRRLRMAEAAVYRDKLRDRFSSFQPGLIADAALLPITGRQAGRADSALAIAASPAETARDLRDLKRDRAMTQRALNVLLAGGAGAYERALAALGADRRQAWEECLTEDPEDGLSYMPEAEALRAWIEENWTQWYERPIAELQYRGAIRDQALGMVYACEELEGPARYEVHLDRKLERSVAMLRRLQERRRPAPDL